MGDSLDQLVKAGWPLQDDGAEAGPSNLMDICIQVIQCLMFAVVSIDHLRLEPDGLVARTSWTTNAGIYKESRSR